MVPAVAGTCSTGRLGGCWPDAGPAMLRCVLRERISGCQIDVAPRADAEADHGLVRESSPALRTALNTTVTVSTTFMAPINIE